MCAVRDYCGEKYFRPWRKCKFIVAKFGGQLTTSPPRNYIATISVCPRWIKLTMCGYHKHQPICRTPVAVQPEKYSMLLSVYIYILWI